MEDVGLALADIVSNMENVPSEVRHLFSEITDLDEKYEEAMARAQEEERRLQSSLREIANRERASESEEKQLQEIDQEHQTAKNLCQEKLRLTRKAMGIVQRHLCKLDMEIRHYDKTPKQPYNNTAHTQQQEQDQQQQAQDTVGLRNGELAFSLPTPKRMDSIPAMALNNALSEADAFYTPSRAPKRRNQSPRPIHRKKQLKMPSSILSLDGIEVDAGNNAAGIEESDDQPYCFCQQVSYGDMVACDGPDCRHEWFHWGCVGLSSPPKGSWYCSECLAKLLEEDE